MAKLRLKNKSGLMRRPTSDYGVQYDNNEMTYRMVQLTSPWP
ncbi:hypothetical protein [Paenibacillus sp. MBLB4367]